MHRALLHEPWLSWDFNEIKVLEVKKSNGCNFCAFYITYIVLLTLDESSSCETAKKDKEERSLNLYVYLLPFLYETKGLSLQYNELKKLSKRVTTQKHVQHIFHVFTLGQCSFVLLEFCYMINNNEQKGYLLITNTIVSLQNTKAEHLSKRKQKKSR